MARPHSKANSMYFSALARAEQHKFPENYLHFLVVSEGPNKAGSKIANF